MKVLMVAPRFFDAVHGEKRAVMSAYKTALSLSKKMPVVVVTAGPPPRYEKVDERLTIYRLWDLYLPDPVNLGLVPGIFTALPAIIRKEKPDTFLINKHMFITSWAAPFLKLMGKKVVIQTDTFVGINWFSRNPIVSLVMRIYAWTIGLLVLKSADKIVLLHEGLAPVAQQLKLPYAVIHNGVDIRRFKQAKPATDIAKKPDEIFICYIGRFESAKGYDDLLAVAKQLTQENKKIKFFFVGNTEGKDQEVQKYASNQVVFTGHRTDIASVLKKMDIFVLPSYGEGLPNALMEAMSVGCACLASDVGGVKVLFKNDEGLRFPPGNQTMLAQQLTRLIKDKNLRRMFGQKAAKRIQKDFDQEKEIVKLIELLRHYANV